MLQKGFKAREDWRTIAAYTGIGLAAGAIDAVGGAGIASTTAIGGLMAHADLRGADVKASREAIGRWKVSLRETGYESSFWPSFFLTDS